VNDPAGVPIDSPCRPSTSPQAIAAGCTRSDGAALTDSSTTCESCSSGFFLFRGGCYKAGVAPGSEICTKAEGGRCTACNAANGLFKNPAASPTLGSECILCSDITSRDGVMGVANCNTCTAPGQAGPATCDTCQDGYYKNGDACQKCDTSCATCSRGANTQCTSCSGSKYLKDSQCVEGASNGCGNGKYADPQSNKCLECGITDCATCEYDAVLQGPKCLTCTTNSNMIKTEVDGTTTCVDAAGCATDNQPGSHFKTDDNKCRLCSDDKTDAATPANKGIANCKTCTKAASGSTPTCSACLDGYYIISGSCTKCADNCATCTSAAINDCTACLPGYFLKTDGTKECVPCDNVEEGGREGCSACSNTNAFKCTDCKPNYRKQQNGEASDDYTCTKTCEDDSACGGTAGACDAIVISASGEMTYYCSLCADNSQYPIDGICKGDSDKAGNTCADGVCTSCTTGYFLYMGGCYSVSKEPGSLMCSKASTTAGICDTPNANSRYFAVPGAAKTDQSVLGCGNPLGTTTGTGDTAKAYVGIQGCKTCTAPSEASNGAMASAKCTACDGSKKPTGSGYGCVTCSIAGCSACRADNMCEACGDEYRMEGETCVRTGGNLSTGAIA
ncbi:Variant-specific surface protein, partial [Giardia duodenalis]